MDLNKYFLFARAETLGFGIGEKGIGFHEIHGHPDNDCSFCLWEDNKFFSSKKKKLTKKIATELLDKGWCDVTGLYTPKKPQLYDAVIPLDDSGGTYVSFKMEFDR